MDVKKSIVIADLLKEDQIPMETLYQQYKSVLELVKILIGVIPNCDTYLEIWPPAFRTYNIMVPNLLNLPFGIFGIGGAPKDMVGLSLYISSLSAECPYCSAHTCSYAMRRGADPEKLANSFIGGDEFTKQELATIAVARSLSIIPCQITQAERDALNSAFKPKDTEWIVLGSVNMGFLNKLMDAISVELESSAAAETYATLGENFSFGQAGRNLSNPKATSAPPKPDSLWTKLSILKYAPKALKMDKEWQEGVPKSWPEIGTYLKDKTGYNFPVLSLLKNKRAPRAIAAVIRENLNPDTTAIGLKTKILTGIVFANSIFDPELVKVINALGRHVGLTDKDFENATQYVHDDIVEQISNDPKIRAAMILVKAASPSPTQITETVVNICDKAKLSSQQIVEIITWISVLQMLHRLKSFYTLDSQ